MLTRMHRFFQSRYVCTAVMLFGLAFIGSICMALAHSFKEHEEQESRAAFERAFVILDEKVNTYLYGLQGVGGVYMTNGFNPSYKKIRNYANFRNFYANFPGALGYGFIRYVKKENLAQYIASMKQVHPNYQLRRLTPVSNQDAYVIESAEPIEQNSLAIGLDLRSETHRRNAAENSILSGAGTITRTVNLVQMEQQARGFLFLLPLYKVPYVPLTAEERKDQIVGWAYAPVVYSAIDKFLSAAMDPYLAVSVYEDLNANPESLILGAKEPAGKIKHERVLEFGGAKWLVRGVYQKDFTYEWNRALPWMLFIFLSTFLILTCLFIRRNLLQKM